MHVAKLTRRTYRPTRPGPTLLDRFRLEAGRAHEVCGAARRRLALWVAARTQGPVLWVRPAWHPDRLHMAGVHAEIDPARLVFVELDRTEDMLWSVEETLRTGAVPLVICDLPDPPGLTPVRRLHLAAEAGAAASEQAPLALLLTPSIGGAAGVESRWRLDPTHGTAAAGWHLMRLKARDAPPAAWTVTRAIAGQPVVFDSQATTPA
jgi:protein ImuA